MLTSTANPSTEREPDLGRQMHTLIAELFPICRSITGDGVRDTLRRLQRIVPLTIVEVPTGTQVFDWVIPKEWNVRDAYVLDPAGRKVIDFKQSNLHLVGYSIPVDAEMPLAELQQHLYSLEDQPDAIPYVTSYYHERWGFCLADARRRELVEGTYRVVVDSTLKDGHLTYGEYLIPGETTDEVFLSTYVCHPSMANNELSGPAVATFIASWLASAPRKYSYRIVFVPETIGAITYASRHLAALQQHVIAGFNLTCIGDERAYSVLVSRKGNTLADRVAKNVLGFRHPGYLTHSFLDRGSDESHYCSPGVDLPLVSLMRSKYGTYPEYHTSLDDLTVVTPRGLQGGFDLVRECLEVIEANARYRVTCCGEPQLGKRGLYPNISTKHSAGVVKTMRNLLVHADGEHDLVDISNIISAPVRELTPIVEQLRAVGLLEAQ